MTPINCLSADIAGCAIISENGNACEEGRRG